MFSSVAKSIVADLLRIAIQQAVIRPLAENLFGGGGGGGSASSGLAGAASKVFSIGKTIGSLFSFGRASGGPVAPGQVYRINEGASPGRVEGFVGPSTGGNIVPLGRMDAMRGGVGQRVGGTIRLELSGDIDARIANVSGPIAIEVVRVNAPGIVELSAAETERRLRRPRLS